MWLTIPISRYPVETQKEINSLKPDCQNNNVNMNTWGIQLEK